MAIGVSDVFTVDEFISFVKINSINQIRHEEEELMEEEEEEEEDEYEEVDEQLVDEEAILYIIRFLLQRPPPVQHHGDMKLDRCCRDLLDKCSALAKIGFLGGAIQLLEDWRDEEDCRNEAEEFDPYPDQKWAYCMVSIALAQYYMLKREFKQAFYDYYIGISILHCFPDMKTILIETLFDLSHLCEEFRQYETAIIIGRKIIQSMSGTNWEKTTDYNVLTKRVSKCFFALGEYESAVAFLECAQLLETENEEEDDTSTRRINRIRIGGP